MSANDRQVDGNHYDAEIKHWDWVAMIGMQYHEGCATKHLQRYDKKGEPVLDLEKSTHYIEKTIELAPLIIGRLRSVRPPPDFIYEATKRFCDANAISGEARRATMILSNWTTISQLEEAINLINGLIIMEPLPAPTTSQAKPVPLEDSNKHAPRRDTIQGDTA